jgi:hypothetical protein
MSGSTFITSLDDESTPQNQRSNDSSALSKISMVVRKFKRKLSKDATPSQNSKIDIFNRSKGQEKQQSLDLAKMDLHDAIRGSIRTSNASVPLGSRGSAPKFSIC